MWIPLSLLQTKQTQPPLIREMLQTSHHLFDPMVQKLVFLERALSRSQICTLTLIALVFPDQFFSTEHTLSIILQLVYLGLWPPILSSTTMLVFCSMDNSLGKGIYPPHRKQLFLKKILSGGINELGLRECLLSVAKEEYSICV